MPRELRGYYPIMATPYTEDGEVDLDTKVNHFTLFNSTPGTSWEGCVEARPYPLDELDVPSKVYDVVKRRLNRLMKEQKEILECASVIGEEFKSDIVGNIIGLNKIQLLKNLSEIEKYFLT